jgi:hypothetical protein
MGWDGGRFPLTDKEIKSDEHNKGELADGRGFGMDGNGLGRNNGSTNRF